MTLDLSIEVEVTRQGDDFMLQTLIANGVTPMFTLTVEQAEVLSQKLQAKISDVRETRRRLLRSVTRPENGLS